MASDMAMRPADYETWQSQIRGRFGIIRYTPDGKQVELIEGGQNFMVSPDERRANQQAFARGQDPFLNGKFTRVELIEDDRDYTKLMEIVDSITDEDLTEIIDGHWKTAEKKINAISSEWPLRRLLEMAENTGAARAKLDAIRARLDAVAPKKPADVYRPDYMPDAPAQPVANAQGQPALGH